MSLAALNGANGTRLETAGSAGSKLMGINGRSHTSLTGGDTAAMEQTKDLRHVNFLKASSVKKSTCPWGTGSWGGSADGGAVASSSRSSVASDAPRTPNKAGIEAPSRQVPRAAGTPSRASAGVFAHMPPPPSPGKSPKVVRSSLFFIAAPHLPFSSHFPLSHTLSTTLAYRWAITRRQSQWSRQRRSCITQTRSRRRRRTRCGEFGSLAARVLTLHARRPSGDASDALSIID